MATTIYSTYAALKYSSVPLVPEPVAEVPLAEFERVKVRFQPDHHNRTRIATEFKRVGMMACFGRGGIRQRRQGSGYEIPRVAKQSVKKGGGIFLETP
jgi:hypothetical protein